MARLKVVYPLNEIETVYHDVVAWSNQYYTVPPFNPNAHPTTLNHS